jgi:uncharacterized protein YpuA (DUF1002 family)
MAKPEVYNDYSKLKKVQFDFSKVEKELAKVTERWEELVNSLDELA